MNLIRFAKNLIIAGLLVSAGISDLKSRRISLYPMLFAGAALVLCAVLERDRAFADILGGMAVGGVLYLASRVTKGRIGEGDACIIGVIGIGSGLLCNLQILCTGLVFAAILSGILLITGTGDRDTRLPFVPFLFAGYLIAAPV